MNSDHAQDASRLDDAHAPAILVPHIDIHAFCASLETADIMRAAAADRRMSRAKMDIDHGGVLAAVAFFQSRPTPAVILVECLGTKGEILAELGRLADVCQPETKVIVAGQVNDISLYRELIIQGVSEYLIAPVKPVQLIETIASLYRNPKAPPLGKVAAFIGARGGAGSSTIAHNFAWALANRHDLSTIIADLDLAFGTVGLNFNEDVQSGILDALSQPERVDGVLLDRLITTVGERLSLLASPGGVERDYSTDFHAVETVLTALRQNVPFVVADLPNQWTPWVKSTVLHSDYVFITATPELASLRNARSLAELLKAARPNDPPPRLVLNQVGVPKRPEIKPSDFCKASALEAAVIIPHDPQGFGAALNRGKMVLEVAPKSKASEALMGLARQIAGPEKQGKKAPSGRSSLFSFRRKK